MAVWQEQVGECSVDPLASTSRVDFLEGSLGTDVQDSLGLEALVLVILVGAHASSEILHVGQAELTEDVLTGRVLIFSCETTHAKFKSIQTKVRLLTR